MKAMLDTNVLIDVLNQREPFFADSKRIFQLVKEKKIDGFVSVQSLKDIFYIFKKAGGRKTDPFKPIEAISFLFNIVDVTAEDSFSALMSEMEDYEDALIAFSALRNGINFIITRNKKDYGVSDIIPIEPSEIDKYLGKEVRTGEYMIELDILRENKL